jgi:hypothetical protein
MAQIGMSLHAVSSYGCRQVCQGLTGTLFAKKEADSGWRHENAGGSSLENETAKTVCHIETICIQAENKVGMGRNVSNAKPACMGQRAFCGGLSWFVVIRSIRGIRLGGRRLRAWV